MEPLYLPDHQPTALLVVYMQNYFFKDPQRAALLQPVLPRINALTAAFDQAGLPVIQVLSAYRPDRSDWDLRMLQENHPTLLRGSEEAGLLDELQVRRRHHQVIKTRYSAFFKTRLASWLRKRGIRRVAVCGAYTHYCVNATIFDAYAHNFVPCLVLDAVISPLPDEAALMVERMRRNGYHLFTSGELIRSLAP